MPTFNQLVRKGRQTSAQWYRRPDGIGAIVSDCQSAQNHGFPFPMLKVRLPARWTAIPCASSPKPNLREIHCYLIFPTRKPWHQAAIRARKSDKYLESVSPRSANYLFQATLIRSTLAFSASSKDMYSPFSPFQVVE